MDIIRQNFKTIGKLKKLCKLSTGETVFAEVWLTAELCRFVVGNGMIKQIVFKNNNWYIMKKVATEAI